MKISMYTGFIETQIYLICWYFDVHIWFAEVHGFLPSRCLCHAKASLTSHHMCMYVLVTEINQLICKGHLSYTCDFMTEYQSRTDPTMKSGMRISWL